MRLFSIVTFCFSTAICIAQVSTTPVALTADSDNSEIARHLYQHEMNQTQTDALALHFPEMTRERAYTIQRGRLAEHSKADQHVGWKLGWTRYTGPEDPLDPIMGHYMSQRVYAEGKPVSTRYFTAGSAAAEPEIVFYLKKDLRGPLVTRADVIDAIDNVGIAMEFVNWRVTEPRTREHAIADNGIAAGVVLGEQRFSIDELDFSSIEGSVSVNGEETSNGKATSIMNEDPVAGIVWAANELPKWGMYLKAGQFIVSGTVCIPLPVSAGDSAEIEFTGMGSLQAEFIQ
ncbi:MAG: 2-keto-4-pentenoate hydratase [Woeseiaceae bacterium]